MERKTATELIKKNLPLKTINATKNSLQRTNYSNLFSHTCCMDKRFIHNNLKPTLLILTTILPTTPVLGKNSISKYIHKRKSLTALHDNCMLNYVIFG